MSKPFTPPPIERADTVLWYPDGQKDADHACPALVNYVAGQTVGLTIYKGGARPVFSPYVRHVDDPFLNEGDVASRREAGAWEYSPMMKRLIAVEEALKDQSKSRSSK